MACPVARLLYGPFAVLVCVAALGVPAAAETYGNARFGYTVAYPANLFAPQPESENGDGRAFLARRGTAKFLVWGGYNAIGLKPAQIAGAAARNCAGRPVYRIAKPSLVAVSCERAGTIFYRKTLIRGDVLTSFEMTYPASERAQWDAVLTKIAGSLVPGRSD